MKICDVRYKDLTYDSSFIFNSFIIINDHMYRQFQFIIIFDHY